MPILAGCRYGCGEEDAGAGAGRAGSAGDGADACGGDAAGGGGDVVGCGAEDGAEAGVCGDDGLPMPILR